VRFFLLCFGCVLASACGGASQGGLTNVPSPSRIELESIEAHDVIANGPESCPRSSDDADPLPNRAGHCPERPKPAPAVKK